MRITSLAPIPRLSESYGLHPIEMKKLGQVVILAGKNGSGKSRVLDYVTKILDKHSGSSNNQPLLDEIANLEAQIVAHKQRSVENPSQTEYFNSQTINTEKRISNVKVIAEYTDACKITTPFNAKRYVKFTPEPGFLVDPLTLADNDRRMSSVGAKEVGMENMTKNSLAYVQQLVIRNVAARSEAVPLTANKRAEAMANFNSFNELLRKYLNVQLVINEDQHAYIFGRPIGDAQLSKGQSILLQLTVALHAQGAGLANYILLLDEPEIHLHPAALIEVIDKIREHIGEGQIWIATHSVNLLAHCDSSEIFYVEDGKVSYGGNEPMKVLHSLLGDEEEIGKLANFLSLPDIMAFNSFSHQCLMAPDVVFTAKDDPQVAQIKTILSNRTEQAGKLKVLDFGIGKGRLLATMAAQPSVDGSLFSDRIDYYGYDIDPTHKDLCLPIIEGIYGAKEVRYFNSIDDILEKVAKKEFDIIIMCNVLHEIDPAHWHGIFADSNSIFSRLKDVGALLIVEDQLLPIGEAPTDKGYLVFNADQIRILFATGPDKGYMYAYHDGKNRLAAHLIPAADVKNVKTDTIKAALVSLSAMAKRKISEVRAKGDHKFANGRLHAFWTTQFANAEFALSAMGGEK